MAYLSLAVIIEVAVLGAVWCRHLVHLFTEAGEARRNYRSTVEGLAVRTHQAAQAELEWARDSTEVAEATQRLVQHAAEVQDGLALERKLRKALQTAPPPRPAPARRAEQKEPPGSSASA